jgi:hypothetical protein
MRQNGGQTTTRVLMRLAVASGIVVSLTGAAAHAAGAVRVARLSATADAVTAASRSASLPRAADVARGRFVASVALDTGALTVVPASAHDRPTLSETKAAEKIWASPVFAGHQKGPLGYGLVTISRQAKGVARITRLPAWIGFAQSRSGEACPAETPSSSAPSLPAAASFPSSGYAAVVIGAATGAPAVTYTARSLVCTSVQPAAVAKATEVESARWRALSPLTNGAFTLRATVPACGTLEGTGSEGSAQSVTVTVDVTVPDVPAHCTGVHTVTQPESLGPPEGAPNPGPASLITSATVIQHARVGPISQVAQGPP